MTYNYFNFNWWFWKLFKALNIYILIKSQTCTLFCCMDASQRSAKGVPGAESVDTNTNNHQSHTLVVRFFDERWAWINDCDGVYHEFWRIVCTMLCFSGFRFTPHMIYWRSWFTFGLFMSYCFGWNENGSLHMGRIPFNCTHPPWNYAYDDVPFMM